LAEINPDGSAKINPPWRLDPLQNIVNISWGSLAVIFGPKDQDAPSPPDLANQQKQLADAKAAG
jgi:hypothetical protein